MSGYVGDSERRRSGYDEYEGVFGPLQVDGGFYSSRSGRERVLGLSGGSGRWRRRGARPPASFDRRANFLEKRSERRRLKLGGGEYDDLDGLEGEGMRSAGRQEGKSGKPGALSKQVCLPTRSFSFRQRSGKLDTRAIGRLDLEKIVATTDVAVIQKHLENLAFADVTLEDVQQYSDAYFLKLFQISQMTLEYLLHVQDSLVEHSESLETQCEQLLDECQQLETENDKQESEIASLKRDIRQKQRTMATLELMLLNATPLKANAQGGNPNDDKENLARGANALVDELLANSADPEGGSATIAKPVACVLCKKRFVSVEYLLRHQQKKHKKGSKKAKRKGKVNDSSESSLSSSGSSSGKHSSKRVPPQPEPIPPPVALPKEVVDALEEKNQLARQLVELQAQVRAEQDARDAQRRSAENQQNQLTAQLMEHLSRLQSALGDIEKKQEIVKADMIKHTEDAIRRMQGEIEAQVASTRRHVTSRVGSVESDPDEAAVHPTSSTKEKTEWMHIEKVMDTFLRAQEQKQHEIEALHQANAKLATKAAKRKKHNRDYPEMPTTLMAMAALDAARYGIDSGRIPVAQDYKRRMKAEMEEKTVQTDEEKETNTKVDRTVKTSIEELPKIKPVNQKPTVQVHAVSSSPIAPLVIKDLATRPIAAVAISQKPVVDKRKLQQESAARQLIAVAVSKFCRRRRLWKQIPWKLSLSMSSLEKLLLPTTMRKLSQVHGQSIEFQVTNGMTANQMRHTVASAISPDRDGDQIQSFDLDDSDEDDCGQKALTLDQVVLRHQRTSIALSGDVVRIHLLKGELAIELLPIPQTSPPVLKINKPNGEVAQQKAVTRIQARMRAFLATKMLARLKAERDAAASRSIRLASVLPAQCATEVDVKNSETQFVDLLDKVKERLVVAMKARAAIVNGIDDSLTPTGSFEEETVVKCLENAALERAKLSHDAQTRTSQIEARFDAFCVEEIRSQPSLDSEPNKFDQSRRRLQRLCSGLTSPECSAQTRRLNELIESVFPAASYIPAGEDGNFKIQHVQNEAESSAKIEPVSSTEIQALADAYEHEADIGSEPDAKPKKDSSIPAPKTLLTTTQPISRLRHAERAISVARSIPVRVESTLNERPGTPTPDAGRPGTPVLEAKANQPSSDLSSPPVGNDASANVISPFSKTPLISRRTNRGAGFQNAR